MEHRKDATARLMASSAIVWLLFAITLGLIQALEFIAPDFLAGIPWLVFPRIRQAHVNGLAFGWLSMAMVAGWYYITPRLTRSPVWSETLGIVCGWVWNVGLAVGVVGLTMGFTQAREYAELAWPIDWVIMALLLATGLNIFMTIRGRTVEHLYVSLWYIMGSLIWFPIVFAIGNVIWAPPTGALMGLNDAIWGWFYGHNILGLWFTTGAVAILYYIIPKEIKQPLYGYTLALVAFWFLAFFYSAVGTHHILQAPVPSWLKTVSVVSSIGLLIPVSAFIINTFMTLRGSWRALYYSIPLRFAVTGATFYLLVSVQGSLQALRNVNQFVHFTNWSVAHAHLALLGFVAFTMWAAIYYMFPRMCGCQVFSERLGWIHWWLTFVGFLGFFLVLTAAGLVQAGGNAQGIPVIQILPSVRGLWIGRAATGSMIIVAQYIFAYNMFMTAKGRQARTEAVIQARKADSESATTAPAGA